MLNFIDRNKKFFKLIAFFLVMSLLPARLFSNSSTGTPSISESVANGSLWYNTWAITNAWDFLFVTNTMPGFSKTGDLCISNFNFSIPTNATIEGIEVYVRSVSDMLMPVIYESRVRLINGTNFPFGMNLADTNNNISTNAMAFHHGSSNDTWGVSLTPAMVNSPLFGVQIAYTNQDSNAHTLSLDGVEMNIFYSTPAPSGPVVVASSPYEFQTNVPAGTNAYVSVSFDEPIFESWGDFIISNLDMNTQLIYANPASGGFNVVGGSNLVLDWTWFSMNKFQPGTQYGIYVGSGSVTNYMGQGNQPYSFHFITEPPPPPNIESNVIAKYFFDSNVMDYQSGMHGFASGSPMHVPGKIGQALYFDGGTKVEISTNAILLGSMTRSAVSFWIKPDNMMGAQSIITTSNFNNDHALLLGLTNGMLYAHAATTPSFFNFYPPTNQWTHIVITKDDMSGALWIDGSHYTNYMIEIFPSSKHYIGSGATGSDGFYTGSVDHLRTYGRPVMPSEVMELYNEGFSGGSNLDPVADAGMDQTFTDYDSNGYEMVYFDGRASYDPDGFITNYTWSTNGVVIAYGSNATASFPVGTYGVELMVVDDKGAVAYDFFYFSVDPVSGGGGGKDYFNALFHVMDGTNAVEVGTNYVSVLESYDKMSWSTITNIETPAMNPFVISEEASMEYVKIQVNNPLYHSNMMGEAEAQWWEWNNRYMVSNSAEIRLGTYTDYSSNTGGGSNITPFADAGPDQNFVDYDSNGYEMVYFDGRASYDPDGFITNYTWSTNGIAFAYGSNATATFPVGTYGVELMVVDDKGAVAYDFFYFSVDPVSGGGDEGKNPFVALIEVQDAASNDAYMGTNYVSVEESDDKMGWYTITNLVFSGTPSFMVSADASMEYVKIRVSNPYYSSNMGEADAQWWEWNNRYMVSNYALITLGFYADYSSGGGTPPSAPAGLGWYGSNLILTNNWSYGGLPDEYSNAAGIYMAIGTHNGKPLYKHQYQEYYIFWDNGADGGSADNEWDLSDIAGGTELLYNIDLPNGEDDPTGPFYESGGGGGPTGYKAAVASWKNGSNIMINEYTNEGGLRPEFADAAGTYVPFTVYQGYSAYEHSSADYYLFYTTNWGGPEGGMYVLGTNFDAFPLLYNASVAGDPVGDGFYWDPDLSNVDPGDPYDTNHGTNEDSSDGGYAVWSGDGVFTLYQGTNGMYPEEYTNVFGTYSANGIYNGYTNYIHDSGMYYIYWETNHGERYVLSENLGGEELFYNPETMGPGDPTKGTFYFFDGGMGGGPDYMPVLNITESGTTAVVVSYSNTNSGQQFINAGMIGTYSFLSNVNGKKAYKHQNHDVYLYFSEMGFWAIGTEINSMEDMLAGGGDSDSPLGEFFAGLSIFTGLYKGDGTEITDSNVTITAYAGLTHDNLKYLGSGTPEKMPFPVPLNEWNTFIKIEAVHPVLGRGSITADMGYWRQFEPPYDGSEPTNVAAIVIGKDEFRFSGNFKYQVSFSSTDLPQGLKVRGIIPGKRLLENEPFVQNGSTFELVTDIQEYKLALIDAPSTLPVVKKFSSTAREAINTVANDLSYRKASGRWLKSVPVTLTLSGEPVSGVTTATNKWEMLSLPYPLSDTDLAYLVGGAGTNDDSSVEGNAFVWNQTNLDYVPAESVDKGHAFWLKSRFAKTFHVNGTNALKDSVTVPLKPGWNMLGTPYPWSFDPEFVKVKSDNGMEISFEAADNSNFIEKQMYVFNGTGYNIVNSPKPYQGYWLWVNRTPADEKLSLVVPSGVSAQDPGQTYSNVPQALGAPVYAKAGQPVYAGTQSTDVEDGDFSMSINVQVSELSDQTTVIGAGKNAKDAIDKFDRHEPPVYKSYVLAASVENGELLNANIKKTVKTVKEWPLVVQTDKKNKPFTVSFEVSGTGLKYFLIDAENGEIYSIDSSKTLTFNSGAGSKSYKIVAAAAGYENEVYKETDITESYAYPNPAEAYTVIRAHVSGLKTSGLVVRIYNERQKLVHQAYLHEIDTGLWEYKWVFDDPAIHSGVYYYKIEALELGEEELKVLHGRIGIVK